MLIGLRQVQACYFFLLGLRYAPTLSNALARDVSSLGVGGYLGSGLMAEFTSDVTRPPTNPSFGLCSTTSDMSCFLLVAHWTWGVSGHDPLAGIEAATGDAPSTRATQYFDLSLEPPRQAISFDVKVERRLEI